MKYLSMGMKFLAINNFENIERTASRNYTQFDKQLSTFMDFGSNEKMLTNLNDMKNKLNKLIEDGQIRDGEFDHQNLSGIMDGAMRVSQKPKKSLDDINDFYISYNNFSDVFNYLRGGK